MVLHLDARRGAVSKILAIWRGGSGPTSKQRKALVDVLRAFPPDLQLALLTDSEAIRGTLTAINWLTGRGNFNRVFGEESVDEALDFLKLEGDTRSQALALVASLKFSEPARSTSSF
jgi:hypothetical protein